MPRHPSLPLRPLAPGSLARGSLARASLRLGPITWGPLLLTLLLALPGRSDDAALLRLLAQRRCSGCHLQGADLVYADLQEADLRGAQLQRANLSQARLDGARLSGANLSDTSLVGASLRGADLRGARLEGTDLRQSDLSGARLDPGALERSHWQEARGVAREQLSYAALHNAGIAAARAGRHPEAEALFSEAIRQQPEAAVSWVGRGLSRGEQGRATEAVADFRQAARLYGEGGDQASALELEQAIRRLEQPQRQAPGGNGMGGQMLQGAAGVMQGLAPLALKLLVPMALMGL